MTLSDDQARRMAEFPPLLRALLEAELAAGEVAVRRDREPRAGHLYDGGSSARRGLVPSWARQVVDRKKRGTKLRSPLDRDAGEA